MSKTLPANVRVFRRNVPVENKGMPYFNAIRDAVAACGLTYAGFHQNPNGYTITAETNHQWSWGSLPDGLQKAAAALDLPETALYDLRAEVEWQNGNKVFTSVFLVGLDPAESTYEEVVVGSNTVADVDADTIQATVTKQVDMLTNLKLSPQMMAQLVVTGAYLLGVI